jgi:hypothetical protein
MNLKISILLFSNVLPYPAGEADPAYPVIFFLAYNLLSTNHEPKNFNFAFLKCSPLSCRRSRSCLSCYFSPIYNLLSTNHEPNFYPVSKLSCRYFAVQEVGCLATFSGVPSHTTCPPLSPASGPRSMM